MDHMPVAFSSCRAAALACVVAAAAFPCAVDAQAPATRHVASQQQPLAKAEKDAPSAKGGQAIVVLVNDEPVTAYEIEQRAKFLLANAQDAGGGDLKAKAEARWQQITKDPKTNERLQQVLREKGVTSREQAVAIQQEFAKGLQREMIEQLRREGRAGRMPQFK